jgi:hypothetical protein
MGETTPSNSYTTKCIYCKRLKGLNQFNIFDNGDKIIQGRQGFTKEKSKLYILTFATIERPAEDLDLNMYLTLNRIFERNVASFLYPCKKHYGNV